MKHLPGLLPQTLPNLLRSSPTLDHGFKVPQQMRPADLPPPGGIPGVGAPAVCDQDAAEPFSQHLLCDLGPTRQTHREDRDPRGHRDPQPGACSPLAPPCLVQVGHGLRADIGLGLGHRGRHGLHGRLLQMRDRPQAHGNAKQVGHDLLGRALRQAIRTRAQRYDSLHAWPKASRWYPEREGGSRGGPTGGAHKAVQLILGDYRLHRGQFGHLMPLRLAILAGQGVPTARAVCGLNREHRLHVFQRHQRPGLAVVPWLPPRLAATGRAALPWSTRHRGITRRRLRGVLGVHPQPLQQALDGGLQRRDPCFECTDIRLRFGWGAFPHIL